eukprot:TRINITY_DN1743_c0_g1_i1.p1 TRINITY_DN1743_c0_g1~~TRINITY_DN1743_c0_g1_i1.p1  ORF type:complete len:240 (-),score=74.56 TRINITY_DN1743_c0_g1_i1:166-786(-)
MGDFLLGGWTMMAEGCPVCHTPLVWDRRRTGDIYCATCQLQCVKEGSAILQIGADKEDSVESENDGATPAVDSPQASCTLTSPSNDTSTTPSSSPSISAPAPSPSVSVPSSSPQPTPHAVSQPFGSLPEVPSSPDAGETSPLPFDNFTQHITFSMHVVGSKMADLTKKLTMNNNTPTDEHTIAKNLQQYAETQRSLLELHNVLRKS